MNGLVRCLREGRLGDSSSAPLGLLQSTARDVAGQLVFREALAEMCTAVAERRAQAQRVVVIALVSPPESYAALAGRTSCPLTTLDCFSDPWGWNADVRTASSGGAKAHTPALADLSQLRAALLADGPAACVAIDDLSALVATHGGPQVAALLADLQSCAHVSCCLAAWQLDRHAEQESVRVDGLAAARLLVRVAHGPGGSPGIHGHIRGETVKRTGCWHVEEGVFVISQGGDLTVMLKKPAPGPAPVSAIPAPTAGTQDPNNLAHDLMVRMDGGMKLTLTEQERVAKEQVVLPYEHRGAGDNAASDFRQYLPPAAGGVGAGSGKQKLGHILYARDSDEGEFDSDEDPDDDLDI
mmetsp:Transcript_33966/g.86845  ORF Transcript_33966/g.86845 Transcript_33966/m.86845 type:complete len:354 (-) Transcript_33966:1343-2404(-)